MVAVISFMEGSGPDLGLSGKKAMSLATEMLARRSSDAFVCDGRGPDCFSFFMFQGLCVKV
jgi:hypothetical protein